MTSIFALITIADRSKSTAVSNLYRECGVPVSLVIRGHGTANSQIMDMLGLDEPQKDLTLALASASACRGVLAALIDRMHFSRPGTGIAFSCALSSISVGASDAVAGNASDYEPDKEDLHMEANKRIEMIVIAVDSGSTDLAVSAAKAAGAHGGTVVKAREVSGEEQTKIFGITVQPEKEIVLMLVPEDIKAAVFKAACGAVLERTGEHAIAFSVPVHETAGLKL